MRVVGGFSRIPRKLLVYGNSGGGSNACQRAKVVQNEISILVCPPSID